MNELQGLTKKLEYLFLRTLIKDLEEKRYSVEHGRKLTRYFLAIEPFVSIEDAKMKMTKFAQHYPTYTELVNYTHAHISERQVESKVRMMRKLLKENKLNEVLKIASK